MSERATHTMAAGSLFHCATISRSARSQNGL
jgi:hypothetical protein